MNSSRLRRLSEEEGEEEEGEEEREEALSGVEIAGLIASFAWVSAYLAAATTECTDVLYLDRYCASDISRQIRVSRETHGEVEIRVLLNPQTLGDITWQYLSAGQFRKERKRRLSNVSKLPADPRDEMMMKLASDIEESEEPEESEGEEHEEHEEHEKKKKIPTVKKNLLQAECGVNAAQGLLFIGRAALEIVGVSHHCALEEHWDFYATIRCAASAQGSLAAFAVTSNWAEVRHAMRPTWMADVCDTDVNPSTVRWMKLDVQCAQTSLIEACNGIPQLEQSPSHF
eukprot:Skav230149  [mRNA]  locus=scaffold1301:290800:293959:- [translate_table: standard]